jgi:Flp pilus assembly protein TadD
MPAQSRSITAVGPASKVGPGLPRSARSPAPGILRLAALTVVALGVLWGAIGAWWFYLRHAHRAVVSTAASASLLPDAPSPEERSLLRSVAAARPGDPIPARGLGAFYQAAGRPFGALWAYSLAVHARESDTAATLGLAQALEAGLFHDAAAARLRSVLAREPGQREARERLAELYVRTGRPEEALRVVRGAGVMAGTTEGALLEGRALEAIGDARSAERAYRRAARPPEDARPWHRLGLLAIAQGRLDGARQALTRARALDPGDPRVLVDLGRVLALTGDPADRRAAMGLFREAVRGRPYAPAYYQSGLLLAREGALAQAAEGFARATVADPDFADAYRELAVVLDRMGRRAEAHRQRALYYSVKDLRALSLREYLRMAEADPSGPDGLLMASDTAFKMIQNVRAAELATRAWERYPGSRQARGHLAALWFVIHRWKSASDLCRTWLREDPDAVEPRWVLGRVAVGERRFDEGIWLYEQALARDPENAGYLETLSAALVDAPGEEKVPRAVATLSRLVTVAPENAEARHRLGVALMRSGRLEEAERQMLRSLDLDPNRSETYSLLVQLAARRREPGAARAFGSLVRAVEERLREELMLWRATWDRPEDPNGYLALARFLVRTGEIRKAESQLEQALALRPHWREAEAELARVRRLRQVL